MKNILLCLLLWLTSSHPALAALAIDGSISGTTVSGSTVSVTLSTSDTNDVIYCFTKVGGVPNAYVTGITDSLGLSWNLRHAYTDSSILDVEGWYAKSSALLSSDVITVTYSASPSSSRVTCFGVNGANFSSPFDANASIPAGQVSTASSITTISETISTSNANDMLLTQCSVGTAFGTVSRPSGFTQVLATGTASDVAYDLVSSLQSSVTETYSWTTASNSTSMIVDAIKAASSGATPSSIINTAF